MAQVGASLVAHVGVVAQDRSRPSRLHTFTPTGPLHSSPPSSLPVPSRAAYLRWLSNLIHSLFVPGIFGKYVSLKGIQDLVLSYRSSMSKWESVTFEESLSFVKRVKARDYMLYLSLIGVLTRSDQVPLEAYNELSFLFRDHGDLLEELRKFRPLPSPSTVYSHSSIWMFIFLMPFLLLSLLLAFEKPLDGFLLRQPS